jgi:hypothetical protein
MNSTVKDAVAAIILAWVQQHHDPAAAKVTRVQHSGSDWAGDTEHGFYSQFGVEVSYQRADGSTGFLDVEGEDMGSLWEAVVR